jgi:acetyltransferase-like isoleucine patch superfamily enzyme
MNTTVTLDMSHDWLQRPLPDNIEVARDCFIQSAHIFGLFHSRLSPGLVMGRGSGIYSQSQLLVGETGRVEIGDYACLNSSTIQCEQSIRIGAHCLLAWGTVITDCEPELAGPLRWPGPTAPGRFPVGANPRPVILEDNVWVGFGAVILPGVRIGRDSIIGSKTVIDSNVPPRSVVAGSPQRLIRSL